MKPSNWAGSRAVFGVAVWTLAQCLLGAPRLAAQDGAGIVVPPVAPLHVADPPPAWASEGVPRSVWMLAEASTAAADEDEGRKLLREAEFEARTSLDGFEEDVGRRFALAVVLGLRAEREGGRTKVLAASELHRELEAILAADPDHARARHMMGRLHAGVRRMGRVTRWIATNLMGGGELKKATWEGAEENLLFAEQRAGDVPDHHLQLANLYRDTGRPEMALTEVEHVLKMSAVSAMELAVRAEALRLREDLGG